MDNEALNIHLEIEALHFGDSQIGGATLEFSTDNTELASKLVYLMELIASIVVTKGRIENEEKERS